MACQGCMCPSGKPPCDHCTGACDCFNKLGELRCENDTDGDGNCHLCVNFPGGCAAFMALPWEVRIKIECDAQDNLSSTDR